MWKINFCCLSHPVCSTMLWKPETTSTPSSATSPSPNMGFLNFSIIDMRDAFVVGTCLSHCRMLSRFPGLYPVNANSSAPRPAPASTRCDEKNASRHCHMSPRRKNYLQLRLKMLKQWLTFYLRIYIAGSQSGRVTQIEKKWTFMINKSRLSILFGDKACLQVYER